MGPANGSCHRHHSTSRADHTAETGMHRVNSMAKTAAWNLARTNVRVNSICPGLIEVRNSAIQSSRFPPGRR